MSSSVSTNGNTGSANGNTGQQTAVLTPQPPADGPLVRPAGPGDHPSIHQFLVSVFQGPSSADFYVQQEDPLYKPCDRLVVKSGHQIVAHLRLCRRELHFGQLVLPADVVTEVATLPEYRGQGCVTSLLQEAERQMRQDGAVLGLMRTRVPQFFARRGWTVCGRHCYSSSGPRDILSYLSATESNRPRMFAPRLLDPNNAEGHGDRLNIRLWRHVEEAALIRLYSENTVGAYGPLYRTEAYWRWLISRRGYDRIYVAIEGPDKFELDEALAPIVGYAAMKEGRIAELMTSPDHPRAAPQLLARACADAIERDIHAVRLDAPPDHSLHQIIDMAGGRYRHHEAENGEVFMVRLFDPLGLLEKLCPQLHQRAKAAELSRPCELGLLLDDERYRLVLSRRGVKLVPGKLGRSYLTCNQGVLTQLLLGHFKVKEAAASGRLDASTQVAVETAAVLFPNLPFWRPPLDELQS